MKIKLDLDIIHKNQFQMDYRSKCKRHEINWEGDRKMESKRGRKRERETEKEKALEDNHNS